MEDRILAVAPMMDWTDRHCRFFLRGFSRNALLYTEMIHANAIVRGDRERLLGYHPEEHPLALQLGGSDPAALAAAARIGVDFGYDEINLNCGCPSDKVQQGEFGACLMNEPARVADCVAAMHAAVPVPVTVKMRIGTVDGYAPDRGEAMRRFDETDFGKLRDFIAQLAAAGCEEMIVHARKAVLGRFSPKDNREVPPLRYDIVARARAEFPTLQFVLNGGLRTSEQVMQALTLVDGVMLGREAYHRPRLLAELAQQLFGEQPVADAELLDRMVRYAAAELARGTRLQAVTRHMLGWFTGDAGSREYRRILSEGARRPDAGADLLTQAAAGVVH
jgi:tRNA-dihydrouridine synthase A